MTKIRLAAIALAIAACTRGDLEPKNRGVRAADTDRPAALSILVSDQRIYVAATGVPGGPKVETIERVGASPEQVFGQLDADLVNMKRAYFANRNDVEIAGDDRHAPRYQDLISVMDHAVKAGFADVGLTDPAGLSWQPPRSR